MSNHFRRISWFGSVRDMQYLVRKVIEASSQGPSMSSSPDPGRPAGTSGGQELGGAALPVADERGQLPDKSIQKAARLLEESSLGTACARQLRDRAPNGMAARIRCRAYFAVNEAGAKWWLSNQDNADALHRKASELAAAGIQEISTLLEYLASAQAVRHVKDDPDHRPECRRENTLFASRLVSFCRQKYDADWRGFELFYQREIGSFVKILRERTGLHEDAARALVNQAMIKAFDDWENVAEMDDPEEWVIGSALQLHRELKLPDEDDSWTYGGTQPGPGLSASSLSTIHGAAVRVTGALARVTDVVPPEEDYHADHRFIISLSFCDGETRESIPSGADRQDSFDEFYRTHYKSALRMATLLVSCDDSAEEVVQEAFTDLCDSWQSLECGHERPLAYLQQNIVNRSRSVLAYRMVAERLIAPARGSALQGEGEGGAAILERSVIINAIRSLPVRQREALVLRYYSDLSEADIAEAMGISRGAVKDHTARAMASLGTAALGTNHVGQDSLETSEDIPAHDDLFNTRAAWISFYDTHYHRVVRFVLQNGASSKDAQDAAHESFAKSWKLMSTDPARWLTIANKPAWIRTAALREYRDRSVLRPRSRLRPHAKIPDLPCSAGLSEITASAQVLLQALRSLDEEPRVIMAFYLDGFATPEIAAELGIAEQQVRDVMKKARVMLQRVLLRIPKAWSSDERVAQRPRQTD